MNKNKLWTKDFTIITWGTVVSMLGSAVSNFSMGILVYDNTESTLLYALFFVAVFLPQLAAPLIAGPFLDRFSRRKTIYMLDFISSGMYFLVAIAIKLNFFNYYLYLFLALVAGAINAIYTVAYDSFYPDLISEGNFSKAYSISSLIYPLANTIMVPLAGWAYETVGLAPLFLFNAVSYFVAAVFETQISKTAEKHRKKAPATYHLQQYKADFKEGAAYLRREKGLLTITLYFVVSMFSGMAMHVVMLPYFKTTPGLTIPMYTLVMSLSTVGRLVGGVIHYRFKYPTHLKYAIAVFVYIAISVLDGLLLFMPVFVMAIFCFITGCLAVTSYNIRISSTQNYIPNDMRGRFNGLFLMITTIGSLAGQLMAGLLGEIMPAPYVMASFMVLNILGVLFIMLPGGKHVKKIYNRDI
ncbi:MAG: MFS transporter [Christensenellales bacterium]|jgi:DHA3 family macrolide efflux protein-like MFS transporter